MKRKFLSVIICIIISTFALTGCTDRATDKGEKKTADNALQEQTADALQGQEGGNLFLTLEADEEGNLVIEEEDITETATYINYLSDGSTIQLIAVRTGDGAVRTAFNTCQSCNPAPGAYFIQKGNAFICQNCGNAFTTDQIGVEKGGCNPAPIAQKTETDGKLLIQTAYLDQYSGNFANWGGPTE